MQTFQRRYSEEENTEEHRERKPGLVGKPETLEILVQFPALPQTSFSDLGQVI